ncbi:MAG: hypothetical protein HDT28_02605 [Clostridiales bacterium]|nr:hypothetical protein [Clostridiales bacterium]
MNISGMTDAVLPLTKKQKCISNIVMGVLLTVAGIILVLAGTGVINARVGEIAAPTILFAFGVAVLVSAIIAKNALSMWLAGVIIACGIPSLITATTPLTMAQVYPIFMAAPAIGCVFSVWFSIAKFPQIKAILFFGVIAALFALASSGVVGYGLAGGLVAAYFGLCVIAVGVQAYFNKDKDDNA